jgi:hypothetical protein
LRRYSLVKEQTLVDRSKVLSLFMALEKFRQRWWGFGKPFESWSEAIALKCRQE